MALTVNQLLALRERQSDPRNQKISEIIVDGNVIKGYFEYTFFTEKTYVKEPERSQGGQIDNLNSYATFLTPTLKISFKAMSADMYRTIMKLINSKNEFQVTAYDPVENAFVTHNMYFAPEEYPELYTYNLEVLAILNYEIELIGTNTSLSTVSIVYHSNPPANMGSDTQLGSTEATFGQEVIIGNDITLPNYAGYSFVGWNTAADGSGTTYQNDTAITISSNRGLVLYAVWSASGTYTLSYNYGLGTTAEKESGEPLYSKLINLNEAIGTLPTTSANKVEYNDAEYDAYDFKGWYWTPRRVDNSTEITASTLYTVQGNSTIYQIYEPKTFTITFNSNGGSSVKSIIQEYGTTIYEPPTPTKSGATFEGWYAASDFSGDEFDFATMPPTNVTLYAKWV